MKLIAGSELRVSSLKTLSRLEENGFTAVEADLYATEDLKFLRGFKTPYYLYHNGVVGYRVSAFPGNLSTYIKYLVQLRNNTSLEVIPILVSTKISTLRVLMKSLSDEGFSSIVLDLGLIMTAHREWSRRSFIRMMENIPYLLDINVLFRIDLPILALCRLFNLPKEYSVIVQSSTYEVYSSGEIVKWFIPIGAESLRSIIKQMNVEVRYLSPAFLEVQEYLEALKSMPELEGLELVHLPLVKGFKTVAELRHKLQKIEPKVEERELTISEYKFDTIIVDHSACDLCGLCIDICPSSAIELDKGLIVVSDNLCKRCGICISLCPKNAIRLAKRLEVETVEE